MAQVISETGSIGLSVAARSDGSVRAAYLRIKDGKIARTREVIPNCLLADEDSKGSVLGIEILRPVTLRDVGRLVPREQGRKIVEEFVKAAMPSVLIASASGRPRSGAQSVARTQIRGAKLVRRKRASSG